MSTNPELSADDAALAVLLAGKREELRVRVAALRAEAVRLEKVMDGMDGTLRLLNPDAAARPPPARGRADADGPRTTPRFAKGECLALMQQALREAAHPLTSTELVRALLAKKSLPASEENNVRLAVRYAMTKGGPNTGIVAVEAQGGWPRWTLANGAEE